MIRILIKKKRVFITFLLLLITISALADYPIFTQRYTADPWGLEYNGRLYLYCSAVPGRFVLPAKSVEDKTHPADIKLPAGHTQQLFAFSRLPVL